jgi:hypothetical protein
VPNNAFTSPRATRLLATVVLALVLCVLPAAASASAGHPRPVSQSQQRAQARAERKLQREARKLQRKAARQAQRSTRQAEREQRRATRASERAGRAGAAGSSAEAPVQSEAPAPEGKGEAPKTDPQVAPSVVAHGCSLTAEASATQVTVGETVTISGKLSCPTAGEAGEQVVTIYQRQAASATPALNVAGTATTEADGSYKLQSGELQGRSVFIVRSASVRHAARAVVLVNAGVSLQGPAASTASLPMGGGGAAGGRARQTFTGTIDPAEANRQVALRVRYADEEWRTVAFARTDDAGHFTFSHRFRFAGDVSVMAVARARGTQRTESPVLTYTVVQAQNPALTIQSSTAPLAPAIALAAGSPTTITGVATGAAHQTVTLLSLVSDGHFTPVTSVQTDESGAYTFTVQPTQTTIYKVSHANVRSAALRVQVG